MARVRPCIRMLAATTRRQRFGHPNSASGRRVEGLTSSVGGEREDLVSSRRQLRSARLCDAHEGAASSLVTTLSWSAQLSPP